jgi:argininosuccinate lyase
MASLGVNAERMEESLDDSMLATDLADYLVQKGLPFRTSHHLVGMLVKRAEELDLSLKELSLAEYQSVSAAFAQDLYARFDIQRSIEARDTEGGTASAAVRAQIERAKALLDQTKTSGSEGSA